MNYPYIIDQLHHHIVHHRDYKILQYRFIKATEILKVVLGDTMYHFVDKLDGINYHKKF